MGKRLFLLFFLCLALFESMAIEIKLTPRISVASETGLAITKGDSIYIDTNSNVSLDILLTEGEYETVDFRIVVVKDTVKRTIPFNEVEIEEDDVLLEGNDLSGDSVFSDFFQTTGEFTIYAIADDLEVEDTLSNVLTVKVYNPIYIRNTASSDELISGYRSGSASFSASVSGGYSSGWTYRWLHEDDYLQGSSSQSLTINGSNATVEQGGNYSVEVANYAEDGTLLYGPQILDGYQLVVYPAVTLSVTNDSEKTVVVSGYNDEIRLSGLREGGPDDGWSYTWYNGSTQINSSGTTCVYKPSAPIGTQRTDNIRFVARCVRNGKTLYSNQSEMGNSNTISLTVYHAVSLSLKNEPEDTVLISGVNDEVNISLEKTGGPSEGWTYKWYKGQELLPETGGSFLYKPTDSSTTRTDTIHVVATCSYDGQEIYSNEGSTDSLHYLRLVVIPAIKVTLFNETGNADIVSGYNDQVRLRIDKLGGPEEGWSYLWYMGDSLLTTESSFSYIPELPSDSVRTDTIRYVVECKYNDKIVYTNEDSTDVSNQVYINVYKPVTAELYGLDSVLEDFGSRMLVHGDQYQLGVSKQGGMGSLEDDDYWTIEWSDPQNPETFLPVDSVLKTFEAVNLQSSQGEENTILTYTHVARLSNVVNGVTIYSTVTPPLEIQVCPGFYSMGKPETLRTCPNSTRSITVNAKVWGGYPDGWSYEWKRDGVVLPEETSTTLSSSGFTNETDEPIDVVYTVTSTNRIGSRICYEGTDTFVVNIWPAVKYEVLCKTPTGQTETINDSSVIPLYVDDKLDYEVIVAGGNPDGWQITWEPSAHVESLNQDGRQFTIIPKDWSTSSSYSENSILKLSNSYDGETWFDTEVKLVYRVYKRATIGVDLLTDSLDIYADGKESILLRVNTFDGYDGTNAWQFDWENSLLGNETTSVAQQSVTVPQIDAFTEMLCQTTVTNRVEDNVGSVSTTNLLRIRLWPMAQYDEVKILNSVRNGELVRANWKASGAYSDNWFYSMYVNGQQVAINNDGSFSEKVDVQFSGEGMEVDTLSCQFMATNYGPYGNAWSRSIRDTSVYVYRQPRTPVQLIRKGDGSSNTFIITFPNGITDELLADNDYQFILGYTDRNGIDHDLQTTRNTRYFHLSSAADFFDSSRKYYVYAVWDYPDGARVTSNKRILNSEEEHYDGSSFDMATRSETTSIAELFTGEINVAGNLFEAHFDKPVKVSATVVSLRGNVVREKHFDIKCDFNERVNLSGLKSGVYLIKYTYGKQVKVERVIVK